MTSPRKTLVEPKFVVVGSNWINVNAISQVRVSNGTDRISVVVHFIGSASDVDQNSVLLEGHEAQEFLNNLEDFRKP
jgi:hypothetical protein